MLLMSVVGWGRRVMLLLGTLLFVLCACAPPVSFTGLKMEEHRTKYRERILMQTLDNGLRVVVVPDYRSNRISVGVHYDVGASDDPEGLDGLAHYAEHVMFYAAYRGPEGPALNEVDLDKNASTLLDRTYFTLSALAVELDPVLELTARRFEAKCDDLDPATLERERDVVIEEAKLKSRAFEMMNGVRSAVWGPSHVYGHDPGGHGFATVPRPALCKFLADHYGPASAVLVVTGNLSDADFQRIRRRFEQIPARPAAPRDRTSIAFAGSTPSARVVIDGLEHPTAMLVFPAPGEGGSADAAIDALQGLVWPLEPNHAARSATTFVVGEERRRAIVAIAEVDDLTKLDELSAAMRQSFAKVRLRQTELDKYREMRRTKLAAELDDPFASAEGIAVEVARGQTPTRFRQLEQLAPLAPADLTRWFDTPNVRTAFLLPQVGVQGKGHVADVATALHDVDIGRAPESGSPLLRLPDARPKLDVIEYQLDNGLRVLLARDPSALAMDARLVIAGTTDPTGSGLDTNAAGKLGPDPGSLTEDVARHLHWYQTVAAHVNGRASDDTTTFQISGLTEYADWHVWNLAWTVLHGAYDARMDSHASSVEPRPPTAHEVAARRLLGVVALPDGKRHAPPTDVLEAFRRANYRPDRATLIISGDFDVAAMETEVATQFGDWKPSGDASVASNPPRVGTAIGIEATDEPTVGFALAFAPPKLFGPADTAAREVLVELLAARMRVVRERLGASYGLHVDSSKRALWIEGAVEPAYAAAAFKAIADELARFRASDPTLAAELAHAKNRVLAHALAMPLAASERASILERAVDGGSASQVNTQVQAIRGVEMAAVQQLAASVIRPERRITVVRGERRAVLAALDALGVTKTEWIEDKRPGGHEVRPSEPPKVAGVGQ